jgi:hypothetical protein
MSAAPPSGAGWQIISGFPAQSSPTNSPRTSQTGLAEIPGFFPRSGAVPLRLGNPGRRQAGASA